MRCCFILILICSTCFAQNVLVKFYRDLPPTIWENTNGVPQLTIAEFEFTPSSSFSAPWSTNWTEARFNQHRTTNEPLYNAWYAQVKAAEQGVFLTNIVILRNLYSSNSAFLGIVATNRPAVTTLALSNQTVTISRILNQLRPSLQDMYKGD